MYPELRGCTIRVNFQPPVIPPLEGYQEIPLNILDSFPVDNSGEERAIQEFNEIIAFNERKSMQKEAVLKRLEEIRKEEEDERILEMKRKAPGLSATILQPTKSESMTNLEKPGEVSFSEFDELSKNNSNQDTIATDLQLLKEIMSSGQDQIQGQFQAMDLNRSVSPVRNANISPNRDATPPTGSGFQNYGSPIPIQQYQMSQSPNSSSSYRQTSQFSSPIPYGSPHHGSPHQHYQPYGSPSSLPPPVSNHQWQPIPPPKVKAATSPKRDSPVKNPLPKNDPLDLKAEHFLQMGFNSDSVKRALQISQNEQNVLDFLFYFEEMVRQGHDPDATQRIIQLVGIADKTSIQSILTNVVGLMEMGFSPIDCVEALHECKNDKEIALDLLLNKK